MGCIATLFPNVSLTDKFSVNANQVGWISLELIDFITNNMIVEQRYKGTGLRSYAQVFCAEISW